MQWPWASFRPETKTSTRRKMEDVCDFVWTAKDDETGKIHKLYIISTFDGETHLAYDSTKKRLVVINVETPDNGV